MAPGGRSFRRVLTHGAALALALLLLPIGAAPALAGAGTDLTSGEEGSGPAPIPVVYPEADRTERAGGATRLRAASSTITFSDLDESDAWARTAIEYVAATNDWMRDFAPRSDGPYRFRPDALETRKYFARALVRAFAPEAVPDPTIVFSDLDPSTVWHRYAAIAVANGWMTANGDGAFRPDRAVNMAEVHRGLVLALGLKKAARSLDRIHTRNGHRFQTQPNLGTTLLGLRLGLRFNAPSGSEAQDVGPRDPMPRSQVAYSLFRAKTQPSWTVPAMLEQYVGIELPFLGPKQRSFVQWGIRYVGYPYVWGGEWGYENQPAPSALGGQPRTGFDCSGITWWIVRKNDSYAWKVAPPRPYRGWSLPQRTSAEMARMTSTRIKYDELKPGDLMFYDGDGNGVVDHVDTYIGNGYALDSSSTPGGVTIMWVGDGWYRDHFVYGRRIFG